MKCKSIFYCMILCFIYTHAYAADSFEEKYESWREYVLMYGNYAGMETSGREAAALIDMGSNVTNKLLLKICTEEDTHMQWALQILLRRISMITMEYPLSTPENLFLNKETVCRQLQEDHFPKKAMNFREDIDTFNKVEPMEASASSSLSLLNRIKTQKIRSISNNGVYALPFCIQKLSQENSEEIFAVFLNMARRIDDYDVFVRNSSATYVNHDDKLQYIIQWWAEEKEKYTELPVLYEQINNLVNELS
ncbi:MAG: hypothetical protein D3920_04115 [Candidatus Electrothrix sp. AW2]|nr:hypothetical protein [Candidatus Electrothrix gigas]